MSKKLLYGVLALFCVFSMASLQAGEKSGLLTDLDTTAGTMGVLSTRTGAATFKIDASTKYVLADGSVGTIADICQGIRVRVTTADGSDVAKKVQVVVSRKKGDPKDPPAGQ